jgi:hypothetical protein
MDPISYELRLGQRYAASGSAEMEVMADQIHRV